MKLPFSGRDISAYFMPRDLSQYGGNFCVEDVHPKDGLEGYINVFIKKPDWCEDFDSIYVGKYKHIIHNFTIKRPHDPDIRFISMDGLIAHATDNKERFDEYKDLEDKLTKISIEQEKASQEGRWMKYMQDHVESLDSLKARGIHDNT